ncbi:DUF3916 domain-containing protein [Xenorhabdus stockiae]|uniref:DUF3916 domain-containing protein n=1 Tax=Xenorhabdus stockiae TaxID=351614 RepID=UPI0040632EB2
MKGCYPSDLSIDERYWNYKIPVEINLIAGKYSTNVIKAQCAQSLIKACSYLIEAKPADAQGFRTTCVICLPDMFTSELCVYTDEEYFQIHTCESVTQHGESKRISDRSLAQEWGLILPDNIQEIGISVESKWSDDPDDQFVGERWYYGEVT